MKKIKFPVFTNLFSAERETGETKKIGTNEQNNQKSSQTVKAVDLFLISFLILFFELAVIRWIPAVIRVAAYFSNIVLISCFLGLGVGCIYRKKRDLLAGVPVLILTLILFAFHIGKAGIENPYKSVEYIFGGGGKYNWVWILPIIFLLNALVFIGLGQKLAVAMNRFAPLTGYSINIFGSLVGTAAFALFSFFNFSPPTWFALSFILVIRLIRKQRKWIILLSLFSAVTGILLVHNYSRHFAWSPYYKIQVNSLSGNPGIAYRLSVNDDYHQFILNLDPRFTAHYEDLEKWRKSYDFPFSLKTLPDKCDILVLGAGTGNDVAAALRNCDCRIDSVELDPMILKIGKNRHPEKPYTNERVRIFTADARAFLTAAKKKYDIIVFGWLDSHRLFSSLSNVRQDNFVYTVEAMKKARHALKKDGLLVLSFYVGADWIGGKIFGMLKEAFSWEPGVYAMAKGGYGPDGQIFVIGNNRDFEMPPPPEGFLDLTPRYQGQQRFSLPTDDWPYLYYKSRHISWEYLLTIFILFAISTLILLPSLRSSEILWQEAVQFFLLGVAFLLLEVRNITTLALVFGSTWLVSSIVIAMVLVMILGANALVARKLVPKNPAFMWGGLIVSIILGFFWNRIGTISSSHTLNALLATFVVSLTFFFAGIIFAYAFSGTKAPGVSLGFNILGAVFGGLLEYACLLVGIGGLSWIALFIYLAAWIFFNSTVRLKK